MTNDIYHCRVCGFKLEEPPWGHDNKTPCYEYCPCCGVEFGYQDASPKGARKFREEWINSGAKWDDLDEKPLQWNLTEQLNQVPEQFK